MTKVNLIGLVAIVLCACLGAERSRDRYPQRHKAQDGIDGAPRASMLIEVDFASMWPALPPDFRKLPSRFAFGATKIGSATDGAMFITHRAPLRDLDGHLKLNNEWMVARGMAKDLPSSDGDSNEAIAARLMATTFAGRASGFKSASISIKAVHWGSEAGSDLVALHLSSAEQPERISLHPLTLQQIPVAPIGKLPSQSDESSTASSTGGPSLLLAGVSRGKDCRSTYDNFLFRSVRSEVVDRAALKGSKRFQKMTYREGEPIGAWIDGRSERSFFSVAKANPIGDLRADGALDANDHGFGVFVEDDAGEPVLVGVHAAVLQFGRKFGVFLPTDGHAHERIAFTQAGALEPWLRAIVAPR